MNNKLSEQVQAVLYEIDDKGVVRVTTVVPGLQEELEKFADDGCFRVFPHPSGEFAVVQDGPYDLEF